MSDFFLNHSKGMALQVPSSIITASLCGMGMSGYSYFGDRMSSTQAGMLAGLSAGSDFVASNIVTPVSGYISSNALSQLSVTTYVKPLLSGLVYIGVDKMAMVDNRPMFKKFLLQLAASAVADQATFPVRQALGLGPKVV